RHRPGRAGAGHRLQGHRRRHRPGPAGEGLLAARVRPDPLAGLAVRRDPAAAVDPPVDVQRVAAVPARQNASSRMREEAFSFRAQERAAVPSLLGDGIGVWLRRRRSNSWTIAVAYPWLRPYSSDSQCARSRQLVSAGPRSRMSNHSWSSYPVVSGIRARSRAWISGEWLTGMGTSKVSGTYQEHCRTAPGRARDL